MVILFMIFVGILIDNWEKVLLLVCFWVMLKELGKLIISCVGFVLLFGLILLFLVGNF